MESLTTTPGIRERPRPDAEVADYFGLCLAAAVAVSDIAAAISSPGSGP